MVLRFTRTRLMASSFLFGVTLAGAATTPHLAFAQTTSGDAAQDNQEISEVVVTGSRIRRTDTETTAPVAVIGQQDLLDRGSTQVGDVINRLTSIAPMTPATVGDGSASGSGQQYPNLFNLGAGRTLTLVNGRRTASSAQGLGDRVVDTNTIPTGLIERVDVVQAGGAAVYGSDAIAGVVNFMLKDDFQGLTVDLQYGQSSRNDYKQPSVRVTAGTNFAQDKGNFAINAEWSKTDPLLFGSRPITNPVTRSLSNPLNTSNTDGIPARVPVVAPHFWSYNNNGVVFRNDNDFQITNLLGFQVDGQQINGYQIAPDGGSVIPYNAGNRYVAGYNCSYPFCSGGEGLDYGELTSLFSGVERYAITMVGHYDLTEHMKLSGELSYGNTRGRDPRGQPAPTVLAAVTTDNPYLTDSARTTLSALQPGFATGTPVYIGKNLDDLLPTRESVDTTDTYRGVISLDGDFDLGDHNFYYNAFYSRSVVKGKSNFYSYSLNRLYTALNSAQDGSGQIVCAINADADSGNDDANCAPLSPFGQNSVSAAARKYITYVADTTYTNTQDDFLMSLGGDVVKLPAGAAKFSVSYEHRKESAKYSPSAADQIGAGDYIIDPSSGRFHTNEFAGELLVPVLGGDFALPGVKSLELTGQYRRVDNSIAGKENVWGLGGRWEVGAGLTLRGSKSRNFRAPSLNQLLAPQTTTIGGGIEDPCDVRAINTGPAPATRRVNCEALFAANPGYGALAGFQNYAFNASDSTLITSGGNPDLRNEISKTTTFGLVWQPHYIPGALTVTADRLVVNLTDGITTFDPSSFAQACFDTSPQPADICSTFTRDSVGTIVTALSTVFNAASVRYKGEVYSINYRFPLSWFLPKYDDPGSLEVSLDATHNQTLETVVQGVTTPSAGTARTPKWVVRSEVRYHRGPLSLSYELYYLPKTKVGYFETAETTAFPTLKANARHSISGSYNVSDKYQVRAGINNLTDRGPSFPSYTYGDILGRQWFLGLRATL